MCRLTIDDMAYFSLPDSRDEGEVYLGYDFTPSETQQIYRLSYSYIDTNGDGYEELVVSIHHVESGRAIIEDLNYGGGRYAE